MKRTDTKVRKLLTDEKSSKSDKYKSLIIGKTDWGTFIKYELIMLFCSWVPGVLGLFLRSKLYPLLLGGVGRGVVFGTNVVMRHPHKIFIGDGVYVDDNCMLDAKGSVNEGIFIGNQVFLGRNSILSCKDGNIRLEDGVNIGFNCEIFSSGEVVIGQNTLVAAYCYLVGGGNYDLSREDVDFAEQDGLDATQGIDIGQGCWLAADVKVLDGVNIGAGSVIGAGAVVRSEIPANSLAAGVPAKVLRSRVPDKNGKAA
ncbi:MAG: acyltransferase [Chloroflexi bacterium]|nr:acyltransferase [Chloroflexota bacterium]